MAWGWVKCGIILILEWTNPLKNQMQKIWMALQINQIFFMQNTILYVYRLDLGVKHD